MKAIISPKYGSPDVLELRELEKPVPGDEEVLIRVHAASLNAYDWRSLRAKPFMVRLVKGLFKPRQPIPGADFAGTVEALGKNVKMFKAGDAVYGCLSESGCGALAEYVCADEKVLALKPAGTTFEEAASIPMAAVTALLGLRDLGQIKDGQKVLINGASGGVGTFAVQIAKSFGAEVTGVCSKGNLAAARSIGADYVIDYAEEDFTKTGRQYDLILDVIANHSVKDLRRALQSNGICVVAGFSSFAHMLPVVLRGSRTAQNDGKKIVMLVSNNSNTYRSELLFINSLLESGKVKPVIDTCYPLAEAAEAFRYIEKGHAKGKVIVTL
jgi:NADPH:quinone reductase-like Zn-dependent oxidoreductase